MSITSYSFDPEKGLIDERPVSTGLLEFKPLYLISNEIYFPESSQPSDQRWQVALSGISDGFPLKLIRKIISWFGMANYIISIKRTCFAEFNSPEAVFRLIRIIPKIEFPLYLPDLSQDNNREVEKYHSSSTFRLKVIPNPKQFTSLLETIRINHKGQEGYTTDSKKLWYDIKDLPDKKMRELYSTVPIPSRGSKISKMEDILLNNIKRLNDTLRLYWEYGLSEDGGKIEAKMNSKGSGEISIDLDIDVQTINNDFEEVDDQEQEQKNNDIESRLQNIDISPHRRTISKEFKGLRDLLDKVSKDTVEEPEKIDKKVYFETIKYFTSQIPTQDKIDVNTDTNNNILNKENLNTISTQSFHQNQSQTNHNKIVSSNSNEIETRKQNCPIERNQGGWWSNNNTRQKHTMGPGNLNYNRQENYKPQQAMKAQYPRTNNQKYKNHSSSDNKKYNNNSFSQKGEGLYNKTYGNESTSNNNNIQRNNRSHRQRDKFEHNQQEYNHWQL